MAVWVFLLLTAFVSSHAEPGFARVQSLSFVVNNNGTSSEDASKELADCVTHFLDKISQGKLQLGAAVAGEEESTIAQSHTLMMQSAQSGVDCTLLWSLGTSTSNESNGVRRKRSPVLGPVLKPVLGALGVGNKPMRQRRSIEEAAGETGEMRVRRGVIMDPKLLRERRSPLLGGLLCELLGICDEDDDGGDDGEEDGGDEDEEEGGDEDEEEGGDDGEDEDMEEMEEMEEMK